MSGALRILGAQMSGQLRIDEPDFKAEAWEKTTHDGRVCWISVCHELLDGRWEGFVAMRFTEPKEEVLVDA